MGDSETNTLYRDTLTGKLSRREIVRRAAALGLTGPAVAALLAAGNGTQEALAASANQANQPVQFVFAHPGPIYSMDAPVTWYISTHWLTNLLYDALIWRAADGNGFVGQAAEKWEALNDTTWRFHLRPGNTFQNGEPLDANAVKWNLDRARTDEKLMVQPQWLFIKDVQVVDKQTVDVITKQPDAYFEADVCFNGAELLPPTYYQQVGPSGFAKKPVGSGPYKLAEFTEGQKYVFEAWDGYWAGKPAVDRVIYQVIPEQASQVAALLANQVDMIPNVPIPDRDNLKKAQGVTLVTHPANFQHMLGVRQQTTSGGFSKAFPGYKLSTLDKRVRQAVSHALDRKTLAEIQGSARPWLLRQESYQPESTGQWASEQAAISYYNPDLAKKLLAEAGYTGGNKPHVHFDAMNFDLGGEKEVAEAVQSMLQAVGFNVDLRVLDASAYAAQVLNPGDNRELLLKVIGGSVSSITALDYQVGYTEPTFDPSNVVQGGWDQTSKAILTTLDATKRKALWQKFWDYYVDEALEVTLYMIDAISAINSKFEWTPRKDGWYTFRDLKVKQ